MDYTNSGYQLEKTYPRAGCLFVVISAIVLWTVIIMFSCN
jgi:hypothetical protein